MLINKNIEIESFFKVKNHLWLGIRLLTNYSSLFFSMIVLFYIRLSTATFLFMIYPVFTNILSVFFLKEVFRIKYLLGCIICFLGSILFLLSERNNELSNKNELDNENNIDEFNSQVDFKVFLGGFLPANSNFSKFFNN